LLLPSREKESRTPDLGFVSTGKSDNEIMGIGDLCGFGDKRLFEFFTFLFNIIKNCRIVTGVEELLTCSSSLPTRPYSMFW
jgi:hypothetical protein